MVRDSTSALREMVEAAEAAPDWAPQRRVARRVRGATRRFFERLDDKVRVKVG